MGYAVAVGPTGRMRLEHDAETVSPDIPETLHGELQTALAHSNAAALVSLASPGWPEKLPSTFAWWRNWVRVFFRAVCHAEAEPGEAWRDLPPPAEDELAALMTSVPPMVGLEYVTPELLRQSWRDLAGHVAGEATADADGPLAWLRRVNPLAHLVGKVTFHLAENKRDPERPFAFLATFAHKLSAGAKPQHRPLAEALKQSVATQDRELLERLLEPVRKTSEQSLGATGMTLSDSELTDIFGIEMEPTTDKPAAKKPARAAAKKRGSSKKTIAVNTTVINRESRVNDCRRHRANFEAGCEAEETPRRKDSHETRTRSTNEVTLSQ
jgi:hypothetical protein